MFKFREIKEVKNNFETKRKVESEGVEEFKKIKSETEITIKEARSFWDEMFG